MTRLLTDFCGVARALLFGLVVTSVLAVIAVSPIANKAAATVYTSTAHGYVYLKNFLGMAIAKLWVTESWSYDGTKITWYESPPEVTAWAWAYSYAYNTNGYATWSKLNTQVVAFGHSAYGTPSPWGPVQSGSLYCYDYCNEYGGWTQKAGKGY